MLNRIIPNSKQCNIIATITHKSSPGMHQLCILIFYRALFIQLTLPQVSSSIGPLLVLIVSICCVCHDVNFVNAIQKWFCNQQQSKGGILAMCHKVICHNARTWTEPQYYQSCSQQFFKCCLPEGHNIPLIHPINTYCTLTPNEKMPKCYLVLL